MRYLVLVLAVAGLSACNQNPEVDEPTVGATRAALTYDGAEAKDRAAQIAHGERLAYVTGCLGCHGPDLAGGNVTENEPAWGEMYAANLSLLIPTYTDGELDRAIRQGVPKDGHKMVFMPSEALQYLSDADVAAIIAYLRTVKPTGKPMPRPRPGPILNAMMESGKYDGTAASVKEWRPKGPIELGPDHALGRYVARTSCTECHDVELAGTPDFTPNLDIVGTYEAPELERLLTTGEGKVRKDLGLMSMTARHRFSKFTPHERTALIAYLKARAERAEEEREGSE